MSRLRSWKQRRVPSHRDIADSLVKGDPDAAERIARDHLDIKGLLVKEHLGSVSVMPRMAAPIEKETERRAGS